MAYPLSDQDRDAVLEIFNIGVGRAADSLSRLMHNQQKVALNVPEIGVIPPDEFPKELVRFTETSLAIKSAISGSLNGITVMIFFEPEIEWIIKHCLSEKEKRRFEAGTFQVPLLMEISNIITASILTQFTNLLDLPVFGLTPENIVSKKGDTLKSLFYDLPPFQPILLSVNTEFTDHKKVIEIPFLFLMEFESVKTLVKAIHSKGGIEYLKHAVIL